MNRIAAFDLGSNSFHLLVADVTPDARITRVIRRKVMLGLGETVATEGALGTRLDDIIETLMELQGVAAAAGATSNVACATAAFRDAMDQQNVLAEIVDRTGLPVAVLSGEVEAQLVFHAVQASMSLTAPTLCLDLGGGSLELMVGDAQHLGWVASVPLGVARLTTQHVRKDPPSSKDIRRLRTAIAQGLDPLLPEIKRREPKMMVGSSGTLKNLAAAALHRRGMAPPDALHGVAVTRAELEDLHEQMLVLTCDQRAKMPGLEPRRAPLVIAGSLLLTMAMKATGLETLTISEWALREGLLLVGSSGALKRPVSPLPLRAPR